MFFVFLVVKRLVFFVFLVVKRLVFFVFLVVKRLVFFVFLVVKRLVFFVFLAVKNAWQNRIIVKGTLLGRFFLGHYVQQELAVAPEHR